MTKLNLSVVQPIRLVVNKIGASGGTNTPATPTANGTVKQREYNVRDYGALGDGVTDDRAAIQAASNACTAAGGGIVFFPAGHYMIYQTPVKPTSNVMYMGTGDASIIEQTGLQPGIGDTTGGYPFFWNDASPATVSNVTWEALTFVGPVNEFPTQPKRGRTTSGNGTYIAIYIRGNLIPGEPSGTFKNVTIRDCNFRNIIHTPIYIGGVTGKVITQGCDFSYTRDVGYIFNQEVIFNDNHIYGSADNGVSISRGNTKITCIGNTVENCAYNGIWLSGFGGQNGPGAFTCVGNTVINVGQSGIFLQDAPVYGTISGNHIDKNYKQGPSDQLSNGPNSGIHIRGNGGSLTDTVRIALGLNVTGNTIRRCPEAGITLIEAYLFNVSANLIVDTGTQFKSDGTTAVSSTDLTLNNGINMQGPEVRNGIIADNEIIDTRGTPYMNYGISPALMPTVNTANNVVSGARSQNTIPTKIGGDLGVVSSAVLQIRTGFSTPVGLFMGNTDAPSSSGGSGIQAGTDLVPTASGQRLGFAYFHGAGANVAGISVFTTSNWSTDKATKMNFETTAAGSSSRAIRMHLDETGLIPEINSTYNLGSSSFYWSQEFTSKLNVNSTASIDGATPGVLNVIGTLNMNAKITNLTTPTNAQDAATKAYVDGIASQINLVSQASQTANFTVASGNYYPVDTTAGNITVTLGTAPANGQVAIKKSDSSVNTVILSGTINGTPATTLTLRLQNEGKVLISDGAGGWNVYAGNIGLAAIDARYLQLALGTTQNVLGAVEVGTTPFAGGNSGINFQSTVSGVNTARFINTGTAGGSGGAGVIALADPGAALGSGNRMGFVLFGGASDAIHTLQAAVGMVAWTTEAWSGTNRGNRLGFETIAIASTSRTERMSLDENGLKPTANNTYGLGTSSNYWSNIYGTRVNMNSTAYLDGQFAGKIVTNGEIWGDKGFKFGAGSSGGTDPLTGAIAGIAAYADLPVFRIVGYATQTADLEQWATSGGNQMIVNSAGQLGIKSAVPTHTVTLGSTITGMAFYSTSDQTTNFARAIITNTGDFTVAMSAGGSGVVGKINLNTSGGSSLVVANGGSASGYLQLLASKSMGSGNLNGIVTGGGVVGAGSGDNIGFYINQTVNASGTNGFSDFVVNRTQTATGSGVQNLADFRVGTVSQVSISPTGVLKFNATVLPAVTVTGSTTLAANQGYTRVNAAGATTQTLPTTPPTGTVLEILNINSGVVTVAGTINGVTNYSLSAQWKYVTVRYDGTNWEIIANN